MLRLVLVVHSVKDGAFVPELVLLEALSEEQELLKVGGMVW